MYRCPSHIRKTDINHVPLAGIGLVSRNLARAYLEESAYLAPLGILHGQDTYKQPKDISDYLSCKNRHRKDHKFNLIERTDALRVSIHRFIVMSYWWKRT